WDYLIDPNRKNYTRVNLRAAVPTGGTLGAYGLNLEGGDGTYRIYYEPASGAITPTTVVVDQPGDPWSPTYVPAGRAVTADMVAVVTDSSSLTMTGYSSDPYIGLFVNDPSGKQLGYAPAKRASDGSFRGTVDLPVEAGFPSGQGLYSVLVATGQLSDTTLMTKWTIPVKLAAGAGAGAATATGGSSATSPSLASLNLADAERALSAGDDYLAGTTYLMALRSATQTGDSATLQRSVQGLLGLAEGARSYLLTDSAAGSLDRGADPLVHTGFAYARAYRRHEALKAFTEVLVADPANAVAADGLKLVSDPAYALSQPSSSPPIYLTKLPDIDIWAKAIIERMNFKGIIRGFADGTFAPDRQVRRDEAVAMVDRVLGFEDEAKVKAQTAGAADVPYADFSSIADWARGYVAAAYAHGLVNLREARFRPSDRATRAEVAVMLVRGLGAEAEQSARGMAGEKTAFADDARIPAWARGYLVYALKNGILTGYGDNTMRPNDPVRRSEMAALAGRIDDRTRTAIDRSELEGTLTKVEAGEPGTIYVLEDGAPSGAGGAAKGLALNPSLYAAGKAIFVLDLKPGSRVRVVTGEGGIVSYVEVLATPSAPKAPGL
ncbi:MAG TPA: S-layer homology domain-containing protein, partial [Bacillota bacterium]